MYVLEYRELIKNLVVNDLKTKYSSSVLGFAWSMLNPLLMMSVLYLVFSNVFKNQDNYIVYVLTGLLVWRFFTIGTGSAMASIVGKPSLVTKIHLPREILTMSVVLSSLISSVLELLVLTILLIILRVHIPITIMLFPAIYLVYFPIIYGLGLILASLYVYYRDLNQIWEVVLQAGFFASPVFYPLSYVPKELMFYYMLNPITRLISMYRDIFMDGIVPSISDFIVVIGCGFVLMTVGTILFKKLSRRFAEEI
jgi:lipopolysaccharide transport system permease protein